MIWRRSIRWTMLMVAASLLLAANPAAADTLHLTNGRTMRGVIRQEEEHQVTIEIGGQYTVTIPRERIARIERQAPLTAYLQEGRRHLDAQRFEQALHAYRRALAEDAQSAVAHNGLHESLLRWAGRLLELKRYDECRDIVEQASRLMPDDPRLDRLAGLIDQAAGHVADIERQAEQMLAVSRFDEAYRLFERARQTMPERKERFDSRLAEALAGRGDDRFKEGRLDEAIGDYENSLRLDPGIDRSHVARYVAARVIRLNARFEQAEGRLPRDELLATAAELRALLELMPDSVHASYLLGVVRRGLHDHDGALSAFKAALGEPLPPGATLDDYHDTARRRAETQEILLSTERERALWEVAAEEFRQERMTPNFIVRHRNPVIARRVALAADYHARRLYTLFMGEETEAVFDPPCRITLYVEAEEFQRAENRPAWSPAVAKTGIGPDGRQRQEWATYQKAPELIASIVPHEMTHLVLRRILPGKRIALWIDEGLAIAQEPEYKKLFLLAGMINTRRLGMSIDFDRLVALDDYPEPRLIATYYAQSMLAVEVLLELGGYDRLFHLIGLLQDADLDEALRETYDLGTDAFRARWERRMDQAEARVGDLPMRGAGDVQNP